MQAIKRKLRSRRGASITFALLLFLVCAVLSSVIIVAASTASGRMSNLAETDRRYYAVTSAAELMKDLLKEPVSIVKRTETTIVQEKTEKIVDKETRKIIPTGEVDENGQPLTEETVSTERTLSNQTKPPVKTTAEKEYLLPKAAEKIENTDYNRNNQISGEGALGTKLLTDSIANEAAYKVYSAKNGDEPLPSRTIQLKSTDESIPEIVMVEELKPKTADRLLSLTMANAKSNPASNDKQYTLKLQFQGSQTNSSTLTENLPSLPPKTVQTIEINTEESTKIENGVEIQVTVTTTTTTTVTTTTTQKRDTNIAEINWELVDIITHSAA